MIEFQHIFNGEFHLLLYLLHFNSWTPFHSSLIRIASWTSPTVIESLLNSGGRFDAQSLESIYHHCLT